MHELAICQALLDQVTHIARQRHAQAVTSITIRVGPLAGVEPDLLQRAFEVARAGSVAGDARLVIEAEPVRIHCPACDLEQTVPANRLRCPDCGRASASITSGDALTLARLDIERTEMASASARDRAGVPHV